MKEWNSGGLRKFVGPRQKPLKEKQLKSSFQSDSQAGNYMKYGDFVCHTYSDIQSHCMCLYFFALPKTWTKIQDTSIAVLH